MHAFVFGGRFTGNFFNIKTPGAGNKIAFLQNKGGFLLVIGEFPIGPGGKTAKQGIAFQSGRSLYYPVTHLPVVDQFTVTKDFGISGSIQLIRHFHIILAYRLITGGLAYGQQGQIQPVGTIGARVNTFGQLPGIQSQRRVDQCHQRFGGTAAGIKRNALVLRGNCGDFATIMMHNNTKTVITVFQLAPDAVALFFQANTAAVYAFAEIRVDRVIERISGIRHTSSLVVECEAIILAGHLLRMTVFSFMSQHAFALLTPDYVLNTVDDTGLHSDGRLLALNSYENRVYQVGIEDAEPLIMKCYRPGRWSDEQILEEHAFSAELLQHGVSAVPPLLINGKTLIHDKNGMRFAFFERRGGRAPDLDNPDSLYTLGQSLGRLHRIGQASTFAYRPGLTIENYGHASVQYILEHMIPESLKTAYQSLCQDLLQMIEEKWQSLGDIGLIRCHGDCHMGNILWRDDAPHYVDFDDARMAPAMQDLWMLLSGERHEQVAQLNEVVEGYEIFHEFDRRELALIEPLRTLRMMHYAAWLSRRWDDPAFPMHFPYFNTERYWGEHILQLREQFFALQQPPLQLQP